MDVVSEPFDVADELTTTLSPVVMRRPGTLRVTGVNDADGKSPGIGVHLFLSEGDAEFQAVRPLAMGLISVKPGRVRLQAKADDGRSFEAEYQVEDGQTIDVEIKVSK